MITGIHRHRVFRLLALFIALGLAAMPLVPGQERAICRMAASIQADCCCAAMAMEPKQEQVGGHDKRRCCEVIAIDQHQPAAAVEAPEPTVAPIALAMVVTVLPEPARIVPALRGHGPEPAPDGPPRRVLWCSFKT